MVTVAMEFYLQPLTMVSAARYFIFNHLQHVKNFIVLPENVISDHCKMITKLNEAIPAERPKN